MKILIVAATQGEIAPLFEADATRPVTGMELDTNTAQTSGLPAMHDLRLLITGVGMVATAFSLGRHLALNQYDLAINLGIAGSFNKNINLGEVVEITTDTMAELGAEDGDSFLPIDQLGFGESTFSANTSVSRLLSDVSPAQNTLLLKQVTGITVNSVHGNEQAIRRVADRLNPQIESMEGAAFFYACKQAGLPCLQIRAVSNYVEKRNRANWQIGPAIQNLNTFANALLQALPL